MTGKERREQLLNVGRSVFAEKGYEATSVEELSQRADVSKPVVYEHFGGKEGLYAVVVDREVEALLERITNALDADHPRAKLEQAAQAFLSYVEEEPDGFRILVRDSPAVGGTGTYANLIGDIAAQVEYILEAEFKDRDYDTKLAGLYSRALVGMVALVGEWWLDAKKPKRDVVVAHVVNIAWNGLKQLDAKPTLISDRGRAKKE
jgi:AcrR family transcriptional regulator